MTNKFKKNEGVIILLYGTSTSGKSSICNSLHKLINNLKIDSTDTAFTRLAEHTFEKVQKYVDDNREQFPDYSYVQNNFTDSEIYSGIMNQELNLNDKKISLLFDLDEDNFEKMLEETIGTINTIEKKAIITLRKIAKGYFDQLFIFAHKEMLARAISDSMQGTPTILDIVPHPARSGQFMIDLFVDHLKTQGYSCPTHIALLHCSIPKLFERILKRNQNAKANNNLEDLRDQSFPFRQYSQLFGASKSTTSIHLGKLKIEDAKRIITPFCVNLSEADKIIQLIGFKNDQMDEITISPKCNFDQIYDSGLQSSEDIAEKLSLEIK